MLIYKYVLNFIMNLIKHYDSCDSLLHMLMIRNLIFIRLQFGFICVFSCYGDLLLSNVCLLIILDSLLMYGYGCSIFMFIIHGFGYVGFRCLTCNDAFITHILSVSFQSLIFALTILLFLIKNRQIIWY